MGVALSHDVRAPLRAVHAFAERLEVTLGSELQGVQREYLRFMIDGATQLNTMLQGLLLLVRVGEDVREPVEAVSIPRLLDQIDVGGLLVRVQGELPLVRGRVSQLRTVTSALTSNALKFRHPDREPELTISTEKEAANSVVLRFQDNGIGVAPSQQNRLFKLFTRLHTREAYPGEGLGLVTVRWIAEEYGGSVWLESDGQTGTAVFLRLPGA